MKPTYYLSDAERQQLLKNYVCSSYSTYGNTARLKVIKLVQDYTISDIPCKAGYPIFFDYNQYFESARFILLAEDAALLVNASGYTVPFAKGTPLTFGCYGRIREGVLATDYNYNGILLKAHTKIKFQSWSPYNSFWSGTIKNDEIINGYYCLKNTEITFEKGELQAFYPSLNGYKDYLGNIKNIGEKCEIFPY